MSSSVVWGIPQLPEDNSGNGDMLTASLFSDGSFTVIIAMSALIVAIAAFGVSITFNRKKRSVTGEDED